MKKKWKVNAVHLYDIIWQIRPDLKIMTTFFSLLQTLRYLREYYLWVFYSPIWLSRRNKAEKP